MCYSGSRFETHMGDCKVRNFKTFKSVTGYNACHLCQGGDCPEGCKEYEELNKDKTKMKKINQSIVDFDLLY